MLMENVLEKLRAMESALELGKWLACELGRLLVSQLAPTWLIEELEVLLGVL